MPEPKGLPNGGVESINEPPGSNVKPAMAEVQTQPAPAATAKPKAAAHEVDPDDLEEEIEEETEHGGKSKKKR